MQSSFFLMPTADLPKRFPSWIQAEPGAEAEGEFRAPNLEELESLDGEGLDSFVVEELCMSLDPDLENTEPWVDPSAAQVLTPLSPGVIEALAELEGEELEEMAIELLEIWQEQIDSIQDEARREQTQAACTMETCVPLLKGLAEMARGAQEGLGLFHLSSV